jgi:hypothetical protein
MSQSDGCADHSQPGSFRRAVIRGLAWIIIRVLARGYRVAVIAPCVDRMYAEARADFVAKAAASKPNTPGNTDTGQYL